MKRYIRNEPKVVRVEACCDTMSKGISDEWVKTDGAVTVLLAWGALNYCPTCGAKVEDVVEGEIRADPVFVECPRCHAPAGTGCAKWGLQPHHERIEAAKAKSAS